jgi:hypothetical protein
MVEEDWGELTIESQQGQPSPVTHTHPGTQLKPKRPPAYLGNTREAAFDATASAGMLFAVTMGVEFGTKSVTGSWGLFPGTWSKIALLGISQYFDSERSL